MSEQDTRQFIVYADFNCPFCYALNERIHALGVTSQVNWRLIQHAPTVISNTCTYDSLCELSSEVKEVRRRAPSTEIRVPTFRPNTDIATKLIHSIDIQDDVLATKLRRSIYRAYWVEGEDISNIHVLNAILLSLESKQIASNFSSEIILNDWQQQWETNDLYKRNIPILIEKGGETVIGFPLQADLESFLLTGKMNSIVEVHGICVLKPRQRILLLENSAESIRMVISQMREYQVDVVKDCCQLIALVEQQGLPDLALLDMKLLESSDGKDWHDCLYDEALGQAVPVILISEHYSIESEVSAFEEGAADYISKPFHAAILKARLSLHLAIHHSQRLLDHMARFDSLTEIPNRREFDLRLDTEWERGARSGTSLALIIIDIDHFKLYNDLYGHTRGDECLTAVARALQSCMLRPSDLLARYGGEEFVILLPETNSEGGIAIANRCLTQIADARIPHDASEVVPYVTVSIGVCTTIPSHTITAQSLLKSADKCLYQAKENGRNQICSSSLATSE